MASCQGFGLLLLVVMITEISASAPACRATFMGSDYMPANKTCKFPVKIGGKEFNSCLKYLGYVKLDQGFQTIDIGESWCPTAGNFELGTNKDHKWGICHSDCESETVNFGCRWDFQKKKLRCELCASGTVEYILTNGTTIYPSGILSLSELKSYGMQPNLPEFPPDAVPDGTLSWERVCLTKERIKELKIKGRGRNRKIKITKKVGYLYEIPAPTVSPTTSEPTFSPTASPIGAPTSAPVTSAPTTSFLYSCEYCTTEFNQATTQRSCCQGVLRRGEYDEPEQKDFFEEKCAWSAGACFDDDIEGASLTCSWCDDRYSTDADTRDCCNGVGPSSSFPGSTSEARAEAKQFFADNCQWNRDVSPKTCEFNNAS